MTISARLRAGVVNGERENVERRRRPAVTAAIGALMAAVVSLSLVGCTGNGYPASVLEGTEITVAWDEALTNVNTASVAGALAGNLEVEQLTRSQFARQRAGKIEYDQGFGSITIADEAEDSFGLSYDLAEPQWSDGIPVDAADLLLAWAAGSNFFATDGGDDAGSADSSDDPLRFDSMPTGMALSDGIPAYEEFERRIDVHFSRPFNGWETALDVAVPAHVVGRHALGVDDPMAAKTAVIESITGSDDAALEKIVSVWNSGFAVGEQQIPREDLLLSSGPYLVEKIDGDDEAPDQRVVLRANAAYVSGPSAGYERITLQRDEGENLENAVGDRYDLVQVVPRADNFTSIRQLDRNDYGVRDIGHGAVWTVRANIAASRPLADDVARSVLMRSFDRGEVVEGGAGAWDDVYTAASSVIFPPGSPDYQVAVEDTGFAATFTGGRDAEDLRAGAGVPAGIPLCVLYDRGSEVAAGMFASFSAQVAEGGWVATDCGSDSPEDVAAGSDDWDIYLGLMPFPSTADELRDQWGSGGAQNHSGASDEGRDELIARLAAETDRYAARDLRVAIEKTIVSQMVVAPLAVDPVLVISDRDIEGVQPRASRYGTLLDRAYSWRPADSDQPSTPQDDEDDEDSDSGLF